MDIAHYINFRHTQLSLGATAPLEPLSLTNPGMHPSSLGTNRRVTFPLPKVSPNLVLEKMLFQTLSNIKTHSVIKLVLLQFAF